MIGWILLGASFVVALFYPWFWIAVGLLGIWKIFLFYKYYGRPWRRVHYPMMRAYARAAGLEYGAAAREGRDFDIRQALTLLLELTTPQWNKEMISRFIEKAYARCQQRDDIHLIENELRRRYPSADSVKICNAMDAMKLNFDSSDNGTMVRMIIAGLIEDKYGSDSRGEYFYELIAGDAD